MKCTVYRKRSDFAGDYEVAYLESTGTQWIDTGIVPGTTTEVEMDFTTGTYKNQTAYFGQNWANSRYMFDMQSNNIVWHGSANTIIAHVADERAQLSVTSDNKLSLAVAGTTTTISISRSATTSNLALFGCNTGTYLATFKLYSMKIWKANELVRDFVPVVISGEGQLYDRVSETFFRNRGTGAFKTGPALKPFRETHMTYYTCRNRKCSISPIESGARFLTTRRCSLQPITLYFDPNGGIAEYTERTANVARRIKEFPATVYDDKHLFSWYDNDGALVSDQDVASVRTQHLTAHWVDPTVVTLDPNGGTCDVASVKLYRNVAAYNLQDIFAVGPSSAPNFIGWFTAASGGTQVKTTTTYNGSYTKLYAHYVSDIWTTGFTVRVDAEHNKAGIYSATRKSSAKHVYVDWGDGFTDDYNGNISQQVHTYAVPGEYHVRISDNISAFALTANSAVWYQVTSQNYYTVVSIDMMAANITTMATYAFCYLNALESAVLAPNVKSIPNYAYYYCGPSWHSVIVPEGVTTIGQYSFAQCRGLSDITLPSTLTTLNTYSFYYCFYTDAGTQSVVIPEGVTAIPNYCFEYCSYLKDITLPSTLTSIGQYSFGYCFYNADSVGAIDIPEGVAKIDNYAFYYCYYLAGATIPSTLTTFGTYVFRYCFYYPEATGDVTFADGPLTTIGNYAFSDCRYLRNVTLPNSLTSTGTYAFYNCYYELKSLTLPAALATIGNYTFSQCYNLVDITCKRSAAPAVSAQTFGNAAASYTGRVNYNKKTNLLHIPAGATGYNASYWNSPLCNASYCGFTRVEDAVLLAAVPFSYVEFNPNGGSGGGMQKCRLGDAVGKIDVQVIAPEGKEFDGWWTMREGGMQVTEETTYDGEWQVVYAHWKDGE